MYDTLITCVSFVLPPCYNYNICLRRLPYVKQEAQQYKLLFLGLYLLIWGEAANLRFMPECLCYIFHHVSLPSISV
jgi:hypothetical protein